MYSLGIDTSNYRTSAALVSDNGEIICDIGEYLDIKKGERGLRQSHALFQHINRLPDILTATFSIAREKGGKIGCVSVSSKPRPVAGSYMPVFIAGISAGKTISATLDIPYFEFSHQEGHIEAVKNYLPLRDTYPLIVFHFSGGTTEALLVDENNINIIGGSRDISYGQLLDRTGVAMGMDFPCGKEMDNLVYDLINSGKKGYNNLLPVIHSDEGYVNLSGIETKALRSVDKIKHEELTAMLFDRIGDSIAHMIQHLTAKFNISNVLFAGGVSASEYIRAYLLRFKHRELNGVNIYFGEPSLSGDNAVGIALLGGKNLWR